MCECVSKVNDLLEEKGVDAEVSQAFALDGTCSRTMVQLARRSDPTKPPKRSTPNLYASHCPFCGEPYAEKKAGSVEIPRELRRSD